jgi:hypothetical protein
VLSRVGRGSGGGRVVTCVSNLRDDTGGGERCGGDSTGPLLGKPVGNFVAYEFSVARDPVDVGGS